MTDITAVDFKYKMTISRMTVDKLGAKLYDKVSAVMAELVANSYDADATIVEITAPMGDYLATRQGNTIIDKGFEIEVKDNGIGMTPDELNNFYLRVGGERRLDKKRGDTSKIFQRKVMGRKGVGKLAPFGICQKIEIITSGGELIKRVNDKGQEEQGYLTAHVILDREKILTDEAQDYHPETGPHDRTLRSSTGTCLILSKFAQRRVPEIDDFARQMAQRFGLSSTNWRIRLNDLNKGPGDRDFERVVGSFDIEKMQGTEIRFVSVPGKDKPEVIGDSGVDLSGIEAGFSLDGRFYPILGWIAYSKDYYKDDLMAGVRIYCRGKIAAQTAVFNRGAGFSGEYSIRSYLIGEFHVDWLDEAEDLIQTDRRDILWSSTLGQEFEKWGQGLVVRMGRIGRTSVKKKTWDIFRETIRAEERVKEIYPAEDQQSIRENAFELARLFGQNIREDELRDTIQNESLLQLSLILAPHITLDKKLQEAADAAETTLQAITEILFTARVAELSSFGRIASERVRVIERIESLKDNPNTLEGVLQNLIATSPWLIDPQWSPITANRSFSSLRKEFEKYYALKTGEAIQLEKFDDSTKRADFVLSTQDNIIQIIEIKQPHYKFTNEEMERLNLYIDLMDAFLNEPNHLRFKQTFPDFHATLVCDSHRLTGVTRKAFDLLVQSGKLSYIDWATFLYNTQRMHKEFLDEADRQKTLAISEAKRREMLPEATPTPLIEGPKDDD